MKSKESLTDKYWREAKSFVVRRTKDIDDPAWYAFEWQDDTRKQWEKYFAWRFGFMPAGMNYLKQGKIGEFLVPCENPRDFDGSYTH